MNFDSNADANDGVGGRFEDKLKVSEIVRMSTVPEEHLISNRETDGVLDF